MNPAFVEREQPGQIPKATFYPKNVAGHPLGVSRAETQSTATAEIP
jgi:hypothetical protein